MRWLASARCISPDARASQTFCEKAAKASRRARLTSYRSTFSRWRAALRSVESSSAAGWANQIAPRARHGNNSNPPPDPDLITHLERQRSADQLELGFFATFRMALRGIAQSDTDAASRRRRNRQE